MKLVTDDTAERRGIDLPSEDGAEEDRLRRLAADRGISVGVLSAAGIGVSDGGGHDGWWRIPYPHRFGVHKYRYRNPDPGSGQKYHDDKGAGFHLYNPLRLGPGEEEIWFAEGEFDTLALIDQGWKAIGIHGTAFVPSEDKDEVTDRRLRKSWLLLFEETLCLTIFDNDEAGRGAGRRLARGLGGEAFDGWDDRYGDVNDWHRADPDGLGEALRAFSSDIRSGRGMATWG